MAEVIVSVSNLTKKYGKKTVVKGISFDVKKGEVFGILGPNGAGKTTTLEMLETLRPIDNGSATLDGIDITKNPEQIKSLIGVQPQAPSFEEKTKLTELIQFFASTYGEKVNPRKFLKDLQLEDKANSYVEQLSGGQRQRFSIAAALVHGPKVFFLDEPTTGLDPQARRNLWGLIKQVRDRGVTVIMTTHYMEEAALLCDRVAVMDNGKIIAMDTPKNLVATLLKKGFKKTDAAIENLAAMTARGFEKVDKRFEKGAPRTAPDRIALFALDCQHRALHLRGKADHRDDEPNDLRRRADPRGGSFSKTSQGSNDGSKNRGDCTRARRNGTHRVTSPHQPFDSLKRRPRGESHDRLGRGFIHDLFGNPQIDHHGFYAY